MVTPPASTSTTSTTSSAPHPPPTSASTTTPPPVVVNDAWKDAFDKLRDEFAKFKIQIADKIDILTDDLDKERKHRASLEIDIDRLKKGQRSLVK